MSSASVGVCVGVLLAVVGTGVSLGQVNGFHVVPSAGGDDFRFLTGISGDGTTVFGASGMLFSGSTEALRWTEASGSVKIGLLVPGDSSRAETSTFDGLRVFGSGTGSSGFVWTAPGTVTTQPDTVAIDVSSDGAVVLTRTTVVGGTTVLLPPLPSDQSLESAGLSASGNAAALTSRFFQSGGGGYGYGGGDPDIEIFQACRWVRGVGTQGCGFLPGTDQSFATSISEDGAVVVGYCRNGINGASKAFRWTESEGMVELAPAQGQAAPSIFEPEDCSADGSVVVGTADSEAVVWRLGQGFRTIKSVLLENGWDLSSWSFVSAVGISDDGLVVTGIANDGGIGVQSIQSYVASLGAVCSGPPQPYQMVQRVLIADGDLLPGGGAASFVQGESVNASGAVVVGSGGDLWLSPVGGGPLVPVISGGSLSGPVLHDGGLITIARSSTAFVGSPPASQIIRSVLLGTPGSLSIVAQQGDTVPASAGGGVLQTYGQFYGPFLSGGGLAVFGCNVDLGGVFQPRVYSQDGVNGGVLVRSAPGVTAASPELLGISDGGIVLRRAEEGLLAGGPPPATHNLIAGVGLDAPGFAPGENYISIGSASINGAGKVAFKATVETLGGPVDAVFTWSPGGTTALLLRSGAPLGGNDSLLDVNSVLVSETGSVYIKARLAGSATGVVLKVKPDGSALVAVREGEQVPGPGLCRQISGLVMSGLDGRRLLMSGTATGLSGSGPVLLTWGEEEGLGTAARSGQTETFRPGLSGQVLSVGVGLASNGHDGRATLFKGGRLVYNAVLAGGQRVVVERALPPLPCGLADIGQQGGVSGGDGRLDNNDFIAFIDLFFGGSSNADVGQQGGVPGADGLLNNNDFIVFIDRFFAGCV